MKIIISESQLNQIINLSEDNDYYNYDNATDAQKQAFYRDKAGYAPKIVKKPKPVPSYVEVWMPKYPGKSAEGKWILMKPFAQWSFAKKWINDNYPRLSKEYYKIVPKYE